MKGVTEGSWAPGFIVALTLVPIILLALVAFTAIKCTSWGPALRSKFWSCGTQAWAKRSFTSGRKRKASDSTGEEPETYNIAFQKA